MWQFQLWYRLLWNLGRTVKHATCFPELKRLMHHFSIFHQLSEQRDRERRKKSCQHERSQSKIHYSLLSPHPIFFEYNLRWFLLVWSSCSYARSMVFAATVEIFASIPISSRCIYTKIRKCIENGKSFCISKTSLKSTQISFRLTNHPNSDRPKPHKHTHTFKYSTKFTLTNAPNIPHDIYIPNREWHPEIRRIRH